MSGIEVAERLRGLWEDKENVHARLIDIASEIERNGEYGDVERYAVEDLKTACEDMAAALSEVLEGNHAGI